MNISTLVGLNLPQEAYLNRRYSYMLFTIYISIIVTVDILSNVDRFTIRKHLQRAIVKPCNVDA